MLNSLDVVLQIGVALQKKESNQFTDSRCHFTTPSCACVDAAAAAALVMLFMFWFVAVVVFVAV